MTEIKSFKDLAIWQRSMDLVETIYNVTKEFPAVEQWGLTSQMRRAAVSVPSNIAEGFGRQSTGDYCRYLSISRGSLSELETQVILCDRLNYFASEVADDILNEIQQVAKMISVLISKVRC